MTLPEYVKTAPEVLGKQDYYHNTNNTNLTHPISLFSKHIQPSLGFIFSKLELCQFHLGIEGVASCPVILPYINTLLILESLERLWKPFGRVSWSELKCFGAPSVSRQHEVRAFSSLLTLFLYMLTF